MLAKKWWQILETKIELFISGPPIILSKNVKHQDVGLQIMMTFYTISSLVSANWQCNGVVMNNSILEFNLQQTHTNVEIYNKNISLFAYETNILVDTNQCFNGNYGVCLSNEFDEYCEQILFVKGNCITESLIILIRNYIWKSSDF